MRAIRRALISLFVAMVAVVIVRLRGTGGTPPRRGGWRALGPDELAALGAPAGTPGSAAPAPARPPVEQPASPGATP